MDVAFGWSLLAGYPPNDPRSRAPSWVIDLPCRQERGRDGNGYVKSDILIGRAKVEACV